MVDVDYLDDGNISEEYNEIKMSKIQKNHFSQYYPDQIHARIFCSIKLGQKIRFFVKFRPKSSRCHSQVSSFNHSDTCTNAFYTMNTYTSENIQSKYNHEWICIAIKYYFILHYVYKTIIYSALCI